jgi:hypothetical protein
MKDKSQYNNKEVYAVTYVHKSAPSCPKFLVGHPFLVKLGFPPPEADSRE